MSAASSDSILDQSRLVVDIYFRGENSTKKSLRMEMERLRADLRSYDSKQETARLTKAKE